MLVQLDIRNFALIDRARLELGGGLTVFSGETGAGKSIVFDALGLLLGGRASADLIRAGADEAVVAGVFVPRGEAAARVAAALTEAGIPVDDTVVVRRSLARSGPNRAWINDQSVTASLLGALTGELLEIVGQHEHLSLLRPGAQRALLDRFGGLDAELGAMRTAWDALVGAREALTRAEQAATEREERQERLRHELAEIEAARVRPGEWADLDGRLLRARNQGRLREAVTAATAALTDDGVSATDLIRRGVDALARLARIDPDVEPLRDRLQAALVEVDDIAADVAARYGDLDDLVDIDALEARHEQLRRLMRRFGLDSDQLPGRADVLRRELVDLEDVEAAIARARRELARAEEAARRAADQLTAARAAAATRLFADVRASLADLGIPHARLELAPIDASAARLGPFGHDGVDVLFSANPGQPLAPLRKVASGGELSRILLAVKLALADTDPVDTYVFDEIDSGIGGAAARVVGRLLGRLGRRAQVLCVTHLGQIAGAATAQVRVEKSVIDGETFSRPQILADTDRVAELARMLGGDPGSAAGLAHARALLDEMAADARA
jgi:DNA repair protein RecN (Recombination protein N)